MLNGFRPRRKMLITLKTIRHFQTEVGNELSRILWFWMEKAIDNENGGFYGQIANDLKINAQAEKSCILNSRILWTFASAYRLFRKDQYHSMARRAFDYLIAHFWDNKYSGLYFMVDHRGKATNPVKHVYNLAFGIYGLSEYYRATGETESLSRAIQLFKMIEECCYDHRNKGYLEARARDWSPSNQWRLGPKDLNVEKSMNTHLHLLEAYTNLKRVWSDEQLKNKLSELIEVILHKVIDPETSHFQLYFNEDWDSKTKLISFGHDIEGSWLLTEAAKELGDQVLLDKVQKIAIAMAQKVYEEGLDLKTGGLFNESENGTLKGTSKVWWPQCEAMVGFINAFELTGKEYFFEAAYEIWSFIERYLVDLINGEWFGEVSGGGKPNPSHDKVGSWKCPYHNGRACMEAIKRLANYHIIIHP